MEDFKTILEDILQDSGNKKIIFLSEADFQFYLAWQIKEKLKGKGKGEVILEYPDDIEDGNDEKKRIYYDILVEDESDKTHLIELKYRTKGQKDVMRYGKKFNLKNQSAQDLGRYHFIKDIERLESQKKIATGKSYCIMLTNDESYWKQRGDSAQDAKFSIHRNRIINGKLEWGGGKKTYRGKDNGIINIRHHYTCDWKPYCTVGDDGSNSEFQYLLLEIPPEKVDEHNHKEVNHG